jgi:hypothetical protein
MRWWLMVSLCIAALLAVGCATGDVDDVVAGDDDDVAADDDDDDDDDDDSYEPPPALGPDFEWDPDDLEGALNLSVEALYYTVPGFTLSLVETMEDLTEQYSTEDCPTVEFSGPPDAVLKTVTGGCTAGEMEFAGAYSLLDEDAGSFHIYTWSAEQFYIRPADSGVDGREDVEDDEYFFHGLVEWSYDGQNVLGTFGQGLGELDANTGFEAHYVGLAPDVPEWNHVYLKGNSTARLNADQEVEYTHDLYVSSNGFYSFTSNAVTIVSDEQICTDEPLSGGITITGSPLTIMFMPDGETACDGTVNVMAGVEQIGYYTEAIW